MQRTQTSETRDIRITSYGAGQVTIDNLKPHEVDALGGAITLGANWVKQREGRLESVSAYEELPRPTDEAMLPFWRPATEAERAAGPAFFHMEKDMPRGSCHSFYISSLCGYHYTPEKYKKSAEWLESCGFQCMRSKRGHDGGYWEVWYLPGLWAAEGDLKEAFGHLAHKELGEKEVRAVAAFVFRSAPYGSFEASSQRMCMGIPD